MKPSDEPLHKGETAVLLFYYYVLKIKLPGPDLRRWSTVKLYIHIESAYKYPRLGSGTSCLGLRSPISLQGHHISEMLEISFYIVIIQTQS